MSTVGQLCQYLDEFAPPTFAETWDNTGFLVGDRNNEVRRLMTCLTVTPETVAEAVSEKVDLIVTHHPMMFRPISKITADSNDGRMLLELIQNKISVYSPHTAFDSTRQGINESICDKLGVTDAAPIKPFDPAAPDLGSGRIGKLINPTSTSDFALTIKNQFQLKLIRLVGNATKSDHKIQTVAVACGSGGSFLRDAINAGADAFVTGETTFHTCLEAKSEGIAMYLLGHFASERFAVGMLAERLNREFDNIEVWPARQETDPVRTG